jgi:fucose 4-O-acetylase-like acetyltransferase
MMLVIDEDLSRRISSLRLIIIVFVVFIHNSAIDKGVNFIDGTEVYTIPVYVQKIVLLMSLFTCAAVPLFFLISSVLLYVKETTYTNNLKKKARTLLIPYAAWNMLVIVCFYIAQSFMFTKQYFPTTIIRNFTTSDLIKAFIGDFDGYHAPIVMQFWFLRDLIILNIFFPVVKKIIDRFPVTLAVVLFILWIINPNIYIVSPVSLFFFSLGYYIVKYNGDYKNIDSIQWSDIGIVYAIIIVIKFFMLPSAPFQPVVYINLIDALNIIISVVFLIKVSHYLIENKKLYGILFYLKDHVFFIYATHTIVQVILIKLTVKLIPMRDGWLLLEYFGVTILCVLLLIGISVFMKKIIPKTYAVLTGGRLA